MEKESSGKSVVLAHPHALIREGIARILSDGGFDVLGQTDGMADLCTIVTNCRPGIIVLDWEISGSHTGIVKELDASFPNTIIVVLTRPHDPQDFLDALAAGADGYLSVNLSPEDFVASIRMLAEGSLVVAKNKADDTMEEITLNLATPPKDDLSNREREVLSLLGTGSTNREIAEELIISEHTVKVHLRTILNKLNLRNRQQAASYATKIGLVKEINPEDK